MRFLFPDRFTLVEPGKRVEAWKFMSTWDEDLRGHFPNRPLVPGSMVLESMLQVVGWLVVRTHDFKILPLFTMLEGAVLPPTLKPGVRLDVSGELVSTNKQGSLCSASVKVEGVEVARLDRILFGHYPAQDPARMRKDYESAGGTA